MLQSVKRSARLERAEARVRAVKTDSAEAMRAAAAKQALAAARKAFAVDKQSKKLQRVFADAVDAWDAADTALRRAIARARGDEVRARKSLAAIQSNAGNVASARGEDPAKVGLSRFESVLDRAAENERRQRRRGAASR